MTKVSILRLDSVTNNDTTATSSINTNFQAIQEAMENTLSRDGTTPNFMDSDLDMNSYRIINAGDPENDTDVITKGWFDQYVDDAAGASATAVAAAERAEGSAQTAQTAAAQAAIAAGQIGDNVRLSRDWAIKMDGTVDGVDYSSKYYASQIIPIASDITTVSGIASDVTAVSGIDSDVTTVSGIASDVTAVADNNTDISAVADDLTNIDTVAGIATDISTVSDIASDVSDVADNETDISTVAGISSDVTTVAGISSDVTTVASNTAAVSNVSTYMSSVRLCADDINNINTVAVDINNVIDVADNKTNIDTVATNISDVSTVAANVSDVNTVAGISSDVSSVASNTTDISTVATDIANINAVAADLTNIDNASQYAAEAKQWAIGDPSEPVDGSAKYWAQQAAGQVIPSQTGHSGEYLTTDGTALSWNAVDALPDQTGQSGKFLTTDGSTASWATASVTVDQVYDSTSANAQSGVAINSAKFIQNTATGTNALTIGGTATTATSAVNIGMETTSTANYGTAVGYKSKVTASSSIALGRVATASGAYSIAMGYGATCSGGKSIQLGYGTNSTATSLFVGFQGVDNYQLLDGSTGIIPYQRINAITDSNLGGQLKSWTGTKAQYDAIVTKDANTLYNITDDTDVSLTILEALYPVGSIYITTNATCPLSTLIAGSTWVQETSRVLVEKKEPTDNDPTWYNLYSDAWCEQGGYISRTSQSANDVTLLKEMADTNYTINATPKGQAAGGNYDFQWITYISVSTTGFTLTNGSLNGNVPASGMSWEVKGYTSTTTSHKQFRRTN